MMITDYFAEHSGKCAVVIAHFNPCLYSQREYNLRQMLRHLAQQGIPAFVGSIAQPGIVLDLEQRSDRVLTFRNRDFLWNRERLINEVVERLVPADYTSICWMNADVIELDYALKTFCEGLHVLSDVRLLAQPFRDVFTTERDGRLLSSRTAATRDAEPANIYALDTGTAWIAPRDFFTKCGLYRYGLSGGSDQLMLATLRDQVDDRLVQQHIGPSFMDHWFQWSAAFKEYRTTLASYLTGNLGGKAVLGWSGSTHAGKVSRLQAARQIKLDDLLIEDGILRWSPTAPEATKQMARQSFMARREDTP